MDSKSFAKAHLVTEDRPITWMAAVYSLFGADLDSIDREDGLVLLSALKFDEKLTADNEAELQRLFRLYRSEFSFVPIHREIVFGDDPQLPDGHWWWLLDKDGVPKAA